MNVNQVLEQAPAKIGQFAEKGENARLAWKKGEITLKKLEAQKHLSFKAMGDSPTQSDLKAKVDADDEIYTMRMDIIGLESDYRRAEIELEKWSNAFVSARKIASLQVEELRSLHDTVKGG